MWSLAFSAGDRHLASATITGEVTVKDFVDGHVMHLQGGPWPPSARWRFLRHGRVLAFTNGGRAVRFWDVDSQVELDELETSGRPDGRVTFSPDGELLAIGEWNDSERAPLCLGLGLENWPPSGGLGRRFGRNQRLGVRT